MEGDEWLVFVFHFFLLAVGGGFGNIRRRRQGAAVFLVERIRFLVGDKDLQAGLRCPFERILKDGFSLSFSLIFCQRVLRLDKGEDKAKQSKAKHSGLSSRRLLLILNLICLSTTKRGFAQVLWFSVIMIDQVSSTERKFFSSHDGS